MTVRANVTLPKLDTFDDETNEERQLRSFLRSALAEPLPPGKDVLIVTIPAPVEAPERALRIFPRAMSFLWRSSASGVQIAGGGEAITIEASGEDRLETLKVEVSKVFDRLLVRPHESAPFAPIMFGGIAFLPHVPPQAPWDEFGSSALSLPRFLYKRHGEGALLAMAVPREELEMPSAPAALADELLARLREFELETATSLIERYTIDASSVFDFPASEWDAYIETVQRAIASGEFSKIVAARRCVVNLPHPIEDTAFMARLFAAYPECTRFAVRRENATFLGATPETLFRKEGLTLKTHALAGTARVQDDPTLDTRPHAKSLRKQVKDLTEHALVVQRICEELMPLCKRLRYSSSPETMQVRNLVHLVTPISAELRADVSVFDLIAALHPTPAVGGFPTKSAARWLGENEPLSRGWYTGTLGWIDGSGNAELAVAIRCGVITPKRVHIFAGAGIVRESSAAAEYAETRAKLYPILRALGIDKLPTL